MKAINKPLQLKKLANDVIKFRNDNDKTFKDFEKETKKPGATLHRIELAQMTSIENLVIVCNWIEKPIQTYFS